MYCEPPPEKPICRCKNCVLREPDNVPFIDVLSLSMADRDNVLRRVSAKANRSMESVASELETTRLSDVKGNDQQEYNFSSVGVNTGSQIYLEKDTQIPTPPPPQPPQPTILLIVLNKPDQQQSASRGYPGYSGAYTSSGPGCCCPPPREPCPGLRYSCPPPRDAGPGCSCPPPRDPGQGCSCPPPRDPCPGLAWSCPPPRDPCPGRRESCPGPRDPCPGCRDSCPGPRDLCPGRRNSCPACKDAYPEPRDPCPGARGYPCPGQGNPCPGARGCPRPGPVYPCPGARRSPDPRPGCTCSGARGPPRRCSGRCCSPTRYCNPPCGPGRRQGSDCNRNTRNCCQVCPKGQPRRSPNCCCADSLKNRCSPSVPRKCRCAGPKPETRPKPNCRPKPTCRTKSARKCKSDYTLESTGGETIDSRWEGSGSEDTLESIECRLAGRGYSKGTICECPEHEPPESPKCYTCNRKSNTSVKSITQREICSEWGAQEVVVTDNTNKNYKCIQVPIRISVGRPTDCRDGKCGNCVNFDDDDDDDNDEDKCSCNFNDKCSCSSQGSDSINSQEADGSGTQGIINLNSPSICSCESQSKCSCYSYGKCTCNYQNVSDECLPTTLPEEKEEGFNLACDLSNLERTLRCLVPNDDCMCFLKKKNRPRRRKKRPPKVCYHRFANPPYIFFPKPKCLDYGVSPYRTVCCCCAPVGMSTYNLDYCCKRGRCRY